RDVRVVWQDALDWKPPKGDVVVFMYNPFRGAVMDAVVERLGQANHGETIVLYHTPLERALFERSGRFELIAEFPFGLVYRTRSGA
ncbi:MAG: hypothetical protein GIW95_04225, partial [Candidatus Eremiobacteraeota bacterium]|nr:hypothetical protein [Candidatus Eremiobacteraeota bacterium]